MIGHSLSNCTPSRSDTLSITASLTLSAMMPRLSNYLYFIYHTIIIAFVDSKAYSTETNFSRHFFFQPKPSTLELLHTFSLSKSNCRRWTSLRGTKLALSHHKQLLMTNLISAVPILTELIKLKKPTRCKYEYLFIRP